MKGFKEFIRGAGEQHLKQISRKFDFEAEAGVERDQKWEGSFDDGMALLEKYFKPKAKALPGSLKILSDEFGPIEWQTMKIKGVITMRARFDGVRSDVEVNGTLIGSNIPVQFRYMQGPSGYSGYRMFRYNNSPLKLLTAIHVRQPTPSRIGRGKSVVYRTRDYFNPDEHK